jgi:hypothetical protein
MNYEVAVGYDLSGTSETTSRGCGPGQSRAIGEKSFDLEIADAPAA